MKMKRIALAAALFVMAFGTGTTSAQNDEEWFTCSVESVCVEYHIQDPGERDNFVRRCANHQLGRMCPNVTGCIQIAPGRLSITYGGDVSKSEFRRHCTQNQGTIHEP